MEIQNHESDLLPAFNKQICFPQSDATAGNFHCDTDTSMSANCSNIEKNSLLNNSLREINNFSELDIPTKLPLQDNTGFETHLNNDYSSLPVSSCNLKTPISDFESYQYSQDTLGQKRKIINIPEENGKAKKSLSSFSVDDKKTIQLRRNIRDVMNETQLDTTTLAAQREESERLARVAGQQKSMQVKKQITNYKCFSQSNQYNTPYFKDSLSDKNGTYIQNREIQKSPLPENYEKSVFSANNFDASKNAVEDYKSTTKNCAINQKIAEVVTIEDSSSDDDCILLSENEEYNEIDDSQNSGLHVKDTYNLPDELGRVVVNVGHSEGEESIYLAPQISKIIKPHQIGGIRFLYDNIIESTKRFKKSSGFGCILAHSMGLGKTLQVISFCDIFLRHTPAKTVLCVMPINTLQNWLHEFNMWIPRTSENQESIRPRNFDIFVLNDQQKTLTARGKVILKWAQKGGVLLIGYELFRLLALKLIPTRKKRTSKNIQFNNDSDLSTNLIDDIHEALVKPGPDLVICDEGHRIKNSQAGISQALKQIRTRRRIVLTGYPLQNNLLEYWCMVDFVRPNYLGTRTEFCNMFERPIQNGQCVDSTPDDIQLMRYRAHVLHSLLLGFVQRRSHEVLEQTLPEKLEYVILVRMTSFQRKLYDTFMTDVRKKTFPNPLKAFAVCCKIWNHPDVLYNFLKKCETELDLDIEDETLKNPETLTNSTTDGNPVPYSNFTTPSLKNNETGENFRLDVLNHEQNNMNLHPSALSTSNSCKELPIDNCSSNKSSYLETMSRDNNGQLCSSDCKSNSLWLDTTTPIKPNYIGPGVNYTKDLENLTGSSQIVDLDTKEIKTVETDIRANNLGSNINFQEIKKTGNSLETPNLGAQNDTTVPMSDAFKKLQRIKKNDEISCSWAVDLMKSYEPGIISNSPKMKIFFCIINESIKLGDRTLLFSQSLLTLNVIEGFLKSSTIPGTDKLWTKNDSYFRLDGSTSSQEREKLVNEFNKNSMVKLFLISTRAGSLGINLTGANRVIIFDASWNPCHDTQAVYRVYRYGQRKPCYVYRLVMDKCLEKKIYDRQIKKQGMSNRVVDECNPEAHLSVKEVTNLCHDYDSDECEQQEEQQKNNLAENVDDKKALPETNEKEPTLLSKEVEKQYNDSIINKIIDDYAQDITKAPFFHESLLVDQKDSKLSQAEKRQAHRSYEIEKKASVNQKFSTTKIHYKVIRNDGTVITRPVASIRPMPVKKTQPNVGSRTTRWIPAEVWQRQGMTAQEMILPLDVVIPTNSAEKSNIILKAGQRVMVLKSAKGIYMQLDSGKIIAIRTTVKTAERQKDTKDIIDITSDCDSDGPKKQSDGPIEALKTDDSAKTSENTKLKEMDKNVNTEVNNQTENHLEPARYEVETKNPEIIEPTTQQKDPGNGAKIYEPPNNHFNKQEHLYQYKHQPFLNQYNSHYQHYNSNSLVQNPIAPTHNPESNLTQNNYFPSYYDYYDNKSAECNYQLNDYSAYSHFNYPQYHNHLHHTSPYAGSTSAYMASSALQRHWTPVVNTPTSSELFNSQSSSFIENACHPNEWSTQ